MNCPHSPDKGRALSPPDPISRTNSRIPCPFHTLPIPFRNKFPDSVPVPYSSHPFQEQIPGFCSRSTLSPPFSGTNGMDLFLFLLRSPELRTNYPSLFLKGYLLPLHRTPVAPPPSLNRYAIPLHHHSVPESHPHRYAIHLHHHSVPESSLNRYATHLHHHSVPKSPPHRYARSSFSGIPGGGD